MDLKKRLAHSIRKESQPAYTYYQIKTEECTITAYTSGKVVFQGKDLSWMEPEQETSNRYPQAGSDEVGTGDYFGPVVVCACIVTAEIKDQLKALGAADSKQINDAKIRQIAPDIRNLCPHSVLILMPEKYNRVHEQHNMVDLKCLLHNQAYVNLKRKGFTLPNFRIVDQFVSEASYYKYLQKEPDVIRPIHFETKAENKYLSVACASILARDTFLRTWDAMEQKYDFHFEKGAGQAVDACAAEFIRRFGTDALSQVAKLHFANTKKALHQGCGSTSA